MNGQLPAIEGITPGYLWIFAAVGVGLLTVALLVFKLVEFIQGQKDRKENRAKQQHARDGKDFTDEVADKVLEKLEPRFAEIEKNLKRDKERIEIHEASINGMNATLGAVRDGMEVVTNALAAVLDFSLHNGNSDEMQKASAEQRKYSNGLIKKV